MKWWKYVIGLLGLLGAAFAASGKSKEVKQLKKVIKQNTLHISFKSNNEERNMYHQVLRRSTLT